MVKFNLQDSIPKLDSRLDVPVHAEEEVNIVYLKNQSSLEEEDGEIKRALMSATTATSV